MMTDDPIKMEGGHNEGSKPSFAAPYAGGNQVTAKKSVQEDPADEARVIEEVITPAPNSEKKAESSFVPIPEQVPTEAAAFVAPSPPQVKEEQVPSTPQYREPLQETAPAEIPSQPESFGDSKNDIGKILSEVKLKERPVLSDSPSEQKQKMSYDTSLASPAPTSEKQTGPPVVADALNTSQTPPSATSETGRGNTISSIVRPLHTLKDDFQDVVRDKKISLVRAAALELDKKRDADHDELEVSTSRKRHMFRIMFAAVLLAILGSAAFFGVALIMKERGGGLAAPPDTSLLFAEAALPLHLGNLSTFALKELLTEARAPDNTILGSIRQIVPTMQGTGGTGDAPGERAATLEEFFSALNVHAPPDLLRALDAEFFFGIHTVDENAPLFVIPVSSYERAFAGMLEWEEVMNADLAPIFTRIPDTKTSLSGTLEERRFEDLVMRNYDVRALKDDAGTIQLYYSFPTRAILIIAESPYSFTEVLSRLRAERKL